MFRVIGIIAALVLAFIAANQIGQFSGSGLLGFIGFFICFWVLARIFIAFGLLLDDGVEEIQDRRRRRQYYGKSKFM